MQGQVRRLSISGGGARGVLALGALAELRAKGMLSDVRECTGTSVGAVLAAGVVMGRTPRDMLRAAEKFPLDVTALVAAAALSKHGHSDGHSDKPLITWIRRVLGIKRKTKPPTLGELYRDTGVTLRINVCNVTDRKGETWTHATHPRVSLLKALRISCGVPVLFAPVKHDGKAYVDGCVARHDHRDADLFIWFRNPVTTAAGAVNQSTTTAAYLVALRETMAAPAARDEPAHKSMGLDPGELGALNFGLAAPAMREAYASGRRQASAWIKKNQ
jgi:hypothetical protein